MAPKQSSKIMQRKQFNGFKSLTQFLTHYCEQLKIAIDDGNKEKERVVFKRVSQCGLKKNKFLKYYEQQQMEK